MTAPTLALDLSKHHAWYSHGDISVVITWLQTDRRPCMVLIPAFASVHFDRMTPCIIPIDSAWLWDEHTGDGRHCATQTIGFIHALGFSPSPRAAFRVTDLIREHLGDLLSCPPMPLSIEQTAVAIATRKDAETGEIISQTEVTEDV